MQALDSGWVKRSNSDVLLVDGYLKNHIRINWELAYEAIAHDAENEPLEWSYEGTAASKAGSV